MLGVDLKSLNISSHEKLARIIAGHMNVNTFKLKTMTWERIKRNLPEDNNKY